MCIVSYIISLNYTASDAKKKKNEFHCEHHSMSYTNNLEKLRTGFNDFVMNPSGCGEEKGKKRQQKRKQLQ